MMDAGISAKTQGYMNEWIVVPSTGFKYQYADSRVFAEALSQYAASSTCTDNHIVKSIFHMDLVT
jgi:hypothetical protein